MAGAASEADVQPMSGPAMWLAGIALALANFIVVLDMTVANVSIPHIAGDLAVSVTTGTWVITSYAVADAICVPLTGWLTNRFGTLRTFLFSIAGFGLFSTLCGISTTLSALVIFRIGQGFCGGPLMPLTQTLLLRVFPKEKHAAAMALWAMTVVVAPIVGPILGGWISDNYDWEWIFLVNIPVVLICFFAVFTMLRGYETPTTKLPIDKVGLALLVIWVGSLQLMLDFGREDDWFSSPFITGCAIVSAIFFVVFVIWELTEKNPIVDLKVFRHRGFTASVVALMLGFGTYFASVVIIPQWLQISLGYTATQAGIAMAFSGVLAVVMSPMVPKLMQMVDPRFLAFFGLSWIGFASYLRTGWTTDSPLFWTIASPQLIQGLGVALFMVPLTVISLSAVQPRETASAAGLLNFGRTISTAFSTSLVTTYWSNQTALDRSGLVGRLNGVDSTLQHLQSLGLTYSQALKSLENMVENQAMAMATVHLFLIAAIVMVIAGLTVFLAPRPKSTKPPAGAH